MTLSQTNPGRSGELAGLAVAGVVRLLMIGVVIILVSVWALSELAYEFGRWVTRSGNPMEKQITLKRKK